MKWIEALKKWNSQDNKSGNWCVPKKGSADHAKVKSYMNSGSKSKKKQITYADIVQENKKKNQKTKKQLTYADIVQENKKKNQEPKTQMQKPKGAVKSKKQVTYRDIVKENKKRVEMEAVKEAGRLGLQLGKAAAQRGFGPQKAAAPQENINVLVPRRKNK